MDYFRVKNWERFQHYKDRDPPWIKLHFSLLSSETWVSLDDASRVLAIACMLIASRNHGQVPVNPAYVKRVAYLNRTPNFKPLIECGFLESASTTLANASEIQAKDTQETETEERQRRGETETDVESATPTGRVFEHWRKTHGHPKASLDAKRRKLIGRALESYSEADLCLCITGYLNSPHHMGQNDRATKYDDIEIFLRDAKHIDAGIRFHAEPPSTLSKLTRQNIASTEGWLPPELRNGTD